MKYTLHKWDEVEEVCKAAIVLFPSIPLVSENLHTQIVLVKIYIVFFSYRSDFLTKKRGAGIFTIKYAT